VSKTEAAPQGWNVWASKDGIAYEVRIDARNGRTIAVIPMENDD
jgi:hypothetical protein